MQAWQQPHTILSDLWPASMSGGHAMPVSSRVAFRSAWLQQVNQRLCPSFKADVKS